MTERACYLVNYLFRRDPDSGAWGRDNYRLLAMPVPHAPGFVRDVGNDDQLSVVVAVPCGGDGEISPDAEAASQALADDHFRRVRPGEALP